MRDSHFRAAKNLSRKLDDCTDRRFESQLQLVTFRRVHRATADLFDFAVVVAANADLKACVCLSGECRLVIANSFQHLKFGFTAGLG